MKIAPDATAEEAIQLLEATGISQLPVIAADVTPVGSVQEVTFARLLHDRRDPSTVKIGDVMARPLPTLDVHTHIDEAYRLRRSPVLRMCSGRTPDTTKALVDGLSVSL